MLPYRLRPPVYGGKLKQQKEKDAENEETASFIERTFPYREGGPLERALYDDLMALRPLYEAQLVISCNTSSLSLAVLAQQDDTIDSSVSSSRMPAAGTAFSAFSHVFAAAKVATVWTSHRAGEYQHDNSSVATGTTDSAAAAASTRTVRGLMPPRCDRNAHAQLVYSVCLTLVRDCCHTNNGFVHNQSRGGDNEVGNDDNDNALDEKSNTLLRHASFAIFLLYALYETNPLPRMPMDTMSLSSSTYTGSASKSSNRLRHHSSNETSTQLLTLPMGQQDRDNPKLLYRQAFYRAPVRLDLNHYTYLLELRHAALVAQNQCQEQWWRTVRQQRDRRDSDPSSSCSKSWSTVWAVASDLHAILDRMLYPKQGHMLEFCSYTGPCSLEGLAGHRDYPYPSADGLLPMGQSRATIATGKTVFTTTTTQSVAAAPNVTSRVDNDSIPSRSLRYSQALERALDMYDTSRQAIRLPVIDGAVERPKTRRIREALAPLFQRRHATTAAAPIVVKQSDRQGKDKVSSLMHDLMLPRVRHAAGHSGVSRKRSKLRHVSFAMGATTQDGDSETESQAPLATEPSKADTSLRPKAALTVDALELILPDSLDTRLQESVRAAVETLLLNRNVGPVVGATPKPVREGAPCAMLRDVVARDNESGSIAQSSLLADATTASGIGQGALRDLLKQARSSGGPILAVPQQKRPALSGVSFLEATSRKDTSRRGTSTYVDTEDDDANSLLSDLSSGSDDDEQMLSASIAHVGQRALQSLLNSSRRLQQTPLHDRGDQHSATGDAEETGTHSGQKSLVSDGGQLDDESTLTLPTQRGASALHELLLKASEQKE